METERLAGSELLDVNMLKINSKLGLCTRSLLVLKMKHSHCLLKILVSVVLELRLLSRRRNSARRLRILIYSKFESLTAPAVFNAPNQREALRGITD